MEIKVYHSQLFANENTKLAVLENISPVVGEDGLVQRKDEIEENSETTLKELYSNGWKLNKVVSAHMSNTSFFFFMEK